jgi:hypothetical protein
MRGVEPLETESLLVMLVLAQYKRERLVLRLYPMQILKFGIRLLFALIGRKERKIYYIGIELR